jgi:hypothetical protein
MTPMQPGPQSPTAHRKHAEQQQRIAASAAMMLAQSLGLLMAAQMLDEVLPPDGASKPDEQLNELLKQTEDPHA